MTRTMPLNKSMNHTEFTERKAFAREELIALSQGNLVSDPPSEFVRLPAPPMLMLDRVVELEQTGARGRIVGEQDIALDAWFFHCHFRGDPVLPGCLGVDAVWQLLGLYCAVAGAAGSGRALGCGEVTFFGQIRPHNRMVRYEVTVRRFSSLPASGSAVAIGDADVLVDGERIYRIVGAKVGTFRGIAYPDYPHVSENARGGVLERREH
jgi:3-hydroxyacyl-[acyl-carrier protein] dehydratase/trans-2-decenoyl-[acyl-carrier protein] isomerase